MIDQRGPGCLIVIILTAYPIVSIVRQIIRTIMNQVLYLKI